MLKLTTRADTSLLAEPLADDVWRVCQPGGADSDRNGTRYEGTAKSLACLLEDGQAFPPGYGLYLATAEAAGSPNHGVTGPVLGLGPELAHLKADDIIHVSADGRRVTVLWKNSARHNGLLLTEQCDNYCLMCSQPPKDREDSWLYDRARKVVDLLPADARALSFTGGEPTLNAEAFIGLLKHCELVAPGLGQAEGVGQQLGGGPARGLVDAALQVADRPRADPGGRGELLLGQSAFGPQLPEQFRTLDGRLLRHGRDPFADLRFPIFCRAPITALGQRCADTGAAGPRTQVIDVRVRISVT